MAFCWRGSDSSVLSENYSAEPLFDVDFSNVIVMKCNNLGYDVWLEKETGLFCHPSQDWYSSWSVVKMKMIRRESSVMSEDEILEGFHFANDYYPRIHH